MSKPKDTTLILKTPLGWCGAVWGRGGLKRIVLPAEELSAVCRLLGLEPTEISFNGVDHTETAPTEDAWHWGPASGHETLERDLRAYFAGQPVEFSVPLDTSGMTSFEREVYEAARMIPHGSVCTYKDLAEKIGKPGAARAVGGAMARNPVPVVVPCHRVVRSDGGPGGFSAPGGVGLKERLLALEGHRPGRQA